MPQQAATTESLPMAFEIVKEMQVTGLDRDTRSELGGNREARSCKLNGSGLYSVLLPAGDGRE